MAEKRSNRKSKLEAVKVVLLVDAGGFALWRYYDTTGNDFQKPLWSKEIELLFETSEVVATLACSTDQTELEKATTRFWILYYGPLCIVENDELAEQMSFFGEELAKTNQRLSDDRRTLKNLSLNIALVCRTQVEDFVQAKRQVPEGIKGVITRGSNKDEFRTLSKNGSGQSKVVSDGQ